MSTSTKPKQNNENKKDGQNLLLATSQGAGYLLVYNIISKIITFTMNYMVFKFTKTESFGIANIQLELLMSTILFLSREGVRCALLRVGELQQPDAASNNKEKSKNFSDEIKRQQFTNISYIPIAFGFCLTPILYLIFNTSTSTETIEYPGFYSTLSLYCIASMIELFSEPLYLLAQNQLNFRLRISIQGKALFGKSLVHFVLSYINFNYSKNYLEFDLICYGLAQLVYASIMLFEFGSHYYKLYGNLNCILPKSITTNANNTNTQLIDFELGKLSLVLTGQSFIKHILTEGDKLILTGMGTIDLQGHYGIVTRYGSLIARMVFQPIEEIVRGVFSKLFDFNSESNNDTQLKEQQNNLTMGQFILKTLFKLYWLMSIIIICFIPNYINCLISLIKMNPFTLDAVIWNMIFAYCCYLPMMAINGVTEALVQSLGSKSKLNQYNQYLILSSIIHLSSASIMLRIYDMGNLSLIIGNIINMGLRIGWAIHFLLNFITHHQMILFKQSQSKSTFLRSTLLHPMILASFFISFWLNWYLNHTYELSTLFQSIKCLFAGGIVFLINLALIFIFEKQFLLDLKQAINSNRKSKLK